ncbi:hypothetical protein ACFL37_01275 [Candidatus Margulisiibacteriota bacterium]
MKYFLTALVVLSLSFQTASLAAIGFRGGLGTDISGGLAIGVNGNYQKDMGFFTSEFGVSLFNANNSYDSTSGGNTYTEKTGLTILGGLTNLLVNYQPNNLFFVAGAGLGLINLTWSETSPTDTSLGTPLPGGGSEQSTDALVAGSVLNLGFGYLFENGFDLRFEAPIVLVFSVPGNAAAVVPAFTITGGMRI